MTTSDRRQRIRDRGRDLEGTLSDAGVTTEDVMALIRADRDSDHGNTVDADDD